MERADPISFGKEEGKSESQKGNEETRDAKVKRKVNRNHPPKNKEKEKRLILGPE